MRSNMAIIREQACSHLGVALVVLEVMSVVVGDAADVVILIVMKYVRLVLIVFQWVIYFFVLCPSNI